VLNDAPTVPFVVLGQPSCWPMVTMQPSGLSCSLEAWPCPCEVTIAWRLPAGARAGRIVVAGSSSAERKTIWIRCTVEAPASGSVVVTVQRSADIDGDGYVDAADLSLLLGDWGGPETRSDINIDGTVDGADHALLLGAWGSAPKAIA